eukprot:CAMPEP_0174385046 /NCGR_PEP_ID=MMETSP0811_2-20130205/126326_1 /TAXON_ID=73025 ORGANISM="Eutreptiella gymnastica-like, Strain CCMP1594" /NCGR_SAMPLE_ID=MMETSP0811_2 /ASSEMBLY_ACC=CAM_ASM_000667 /LENGTH=139 /DNA_ID=CAMNT_0015539209 /DNA_START=1043 /DNA_END=1463 /DNA_ORIENTATION=-
MRMLAHEMADTHLNFYGLTLNGIRLLVRYRPLASPPVASGRSCRSTRSCVPLHRVLAAALCPIEDCSCGTCPISDASMDVEIGAQTTRQNQWAAHKTELLFHESEPAFQTLNLCPADFADPDQWSADAKQRPGDPTERM